MPSGFPPKPVYPLAIDSNETLYLVYNTTETTLAADNIAWSDEIDIIAQDVNSPEIWATNGFANISGELLYYDAVEYDINGKINKLKRCARNIGGTHTQFNPVGTWIRGFVIAEHHEQLVDAINALETFIGIENSLDVTTLDYRIRHIQAQIPCMDDGNCPSVDFNYVITSSDPCTGTLISYSLNVTGNFTTFRLDFGDGTSTTSTQNGTHLYPANAVIDPFVVVGNNDCQSVITALQRTVDTQPKVASLPVPLEIAVPTLPQLPTISISPLTVGTPDITLPPLIQPCPPELGAISIGPISVPSAISLIGVIPSFISTNIPSFISTNIPSFISTNIPSHISITPSVISIVPQIPSSITIIGTIPTTINVIDSIPTTINVIAPQLGPIQFGPAPPLNVNWGTPPTLSCTVSVVCTGCCSQSSPKPFLGDIWEDEMPAITADLNYENVIPSQIDLIVPEIPDISLIHNLPTEIHLKALDLPEFIDLRHNLPANIELINSPNLISSVKLDTSGLPKQISLNLTSDIPHEISLVGLEIPSVISVDASSMPSVISVNMLSEIELKMPSEIPMRLINPEITVKLEMGKLVSENMSNLQCVAIVPCNP
jgi:hypothetical protein